MTIKFFDVHAHFDRKIRSGKTNDYKIIQNWDYWKHPKQYPENNFSVGLHPWYLDEFEKESDVIHFLETHAKQENCVAIGEIGLDYFRLNHSQEQQEMVFETVLNWAAQNNQGSKPIVLHSVKSETAVLQILKKINFTGTLVWHNYLLGKFPQVNFPLYASLSFRFFQMPKEKKEKILSSIPINKILLESDEQEDVDFETFLNDLNQYIKIDHLQLAENFKLSFS